MPRIFESCPELRTFTALDVLWRDVRHGARTLMRARAFSTVAVCSLALGIGANTALFSLMDIMLLRALPVKNPQELVEFVRAHPDGSMMTNLPYAVFQYFRRDHTVLSEVFAISWSSPVFRARGAAQRATAYEVSGAFFPALGVNALLGRTIRPDDDRAGAANHVAVLSYGFWSRYFGRDPAVLGATARISGEPFTVVGVMPPDFVGVDRSELPDLWVPLALDPDPGEVWVLGRLKPGILIPQARAQLAPLFQQALDSMRDRFGSAPAREVEAFLSQKLLVNSASRGTSGLRWTYWEYSYTLKILAGLTLLILLIACANLASLLMARSADREREIGIRLAIGAGRGRLFRQLLTESLLLSVGGGALGLLVAAWGHRLMLAFLVGRTETVALDFRLDYRVLGLGLVLSVVTGLLFGLMPAIRATRTDVAFMIRGEARQRGCMRMPLAKALLAAQIGLAVVLLVAAGLFARSLRNLGAADLGLVREKLVLMDVRAAGTTTQARRAFWTQLTERAAALAGVRSLALAGDAVFGNGGWNQTIWIQRPGQAAQYASVSDNLISPGFFATAGIPILTGREFGAQDRENAPLVAVVNLTFARRFFGAGNPIGKRFGDRGAESSGRYEIVGVVGDAKYGSVRERPRPMVFHPLLQEPPRESLVLHVRTAADPAGVVPLIQRQILSIDNEALVSGIRTLPQVIRDQLRQDRMFATLASFFAGLGLVLGAIGIYGLVAYRVAHRTAEIGLRMALGAQRADVLWLILRETLWLLVTGALLGLPAALAGARLIRSLLYAVGPADPMTIACAILTLGAAGALAGFLPARRAAGIQPMTALRSE
ncbi:MAG TPA: ABC transporter permease [Bryobacteraceae bacterium]|nr:ABC transporter permease [Bryobacteraceae bacterium]